MEEKKIRSKGRAQHSTPRMSPARGSRTESAGAKFYLRRKKLPKSRRVTEAAGAGRSRSRARAQAAAAVAQSSDARRPDPPNGRVEPHLPTPASRLCPRERAAGSPLGLPAAARTLTWPSLPLLPFASPPALLPSESGSVGIRRRGNNDPCSCIAENLRGGGGAASCGRWKRGFWGAQENSRGAESARARRGEPAGLRCARAAGLPAVPAWRPGRTAPAASRLERREGRRRLPAAGVFGQ